MLIVKNKEKLWETVYRKNHQNLMINSMWSNGLRKMKSRKSSFPVYEKSYLGIISIKNYGYWADG